MGRNTYNPLPRIISVSLDELRTGKGVSVSDNINYINNLALELGQALSILRQSNQKPTVEELERLECKCWAIMTAVEEII